LVNAIEIAELSYSYPGRTKPVLELKYLTVERGEFCWIAGLNGAGKTTLCRSLTGLIPHFFHGQLSGSLKLFGQEVSQMSLSQITGIAGLILDDPFEQLTRATYSVRDEIAFGLQNIALPPAEIIKRVDQSLTELKITELADRIPTSLSVGEQQRVAIAAIFARQPEILVLDEVTSQLDPQGVHAIFRLVEHFKETGKTILMVESRFDKISQYAERILVLQQGKLVADGAVKTILNDDILEKNYLELPSYPALAKTLKSKGRVSGQVPVTLEEACQMLDEVRHGAH
jgi:energy-coupling factor transporter ATP-binding protein EcfA2